MRYVVFALPVVAALIALAFFGKDTVPPTDATFVTGNSADAVPLGPTLSPITYVKPNPYDWNKDGCPDLIALSASNQILLFHGVCAPNTPTRFANDPVQLGIAPLAIDGMLLPGDFDHDGCADIIFHLVATPDPLLLNRGDCAAGFKGATITLPLTWSQYDFIIGVGSWDGDGCMDLMGRRRAEKDLILYTFDCNGHVTALYGLGDFGAFDWFNGPTRWDYEFGLFDSCGDLLGRKASDQSLVFFPGDCAHGFKFAPETVGTGWGGFDLIFSGGDWDSDAQDCPDVMASRIDNGQLRFYFSDCVGGFSDGDRQESDRDWREFPLIASDVIRLGPLSTPTPAPTPATLKGDLNCDLQITVADVQIELMNVAGVPNAAPAACTGVVLLDMNCDQELTGFDPLVIIRSAAGLATALPVGCTPVPITIE